MWSMELYISPGALRKGAGQNPWPAPLRFGLWHLDSHADGHRYKLDDGFLQTRALRDAKLSVSLNDLSNRPEDAGSVRLAYRLEQAAELWLLWWQAPTAHTGCLYQSSATYTCHHRHGWFLSHQQRCSNP